MILSIQFRTILKISSHYCQNQSSPLKKTKDLRIRSPRIGQNNAEIGLEPSQKYLKFGNENEIGKTMPPAKAQRRQGDGARPVIPSECEGSEKDFSLWSK